MKPLIGITCHHNFEYQYLLNHSYVQSVTEAGGIPLLLAMGLKNDVGSLVERLDGLLLSGGFDINPLFYDEEPIKELGEISPGRDDNEMELVRAFLQADKPVLGICRGHQVLNVAQGGTMYQDIHALMDGDILQHVQNARRDHLSHRVELVENSKISTIFGTTNILVNSFHHQAVKDVSDGFTVGGTASDGVIEAIESEKHKFVIGVQWHPENTACAGDVPSNRLFNAFVEACS
ncbi:gamma-glutamyl-gamma-aminobutyrate hydrolase family protein [Sporosarcina gallistercoris]|uniref:Gamma-glutamyl-gamma-aminobutyrate hydrolase family protein n=1 Tax=Sporosarcina gallistercoris TaxID=2762245 RepID=A0ABR8PLN5_9BACL|nr:gamma-glutamyl-gamma-aminobutyrate hydrolase family protein [Sporosarcina gallistercoris]MBD7909040.1 gamma-glutamyl-gamma-aminobutyrate hydrolase family protein [Sporosarcina gallistercoris]